MLRLKPFDYILFALFAAAAVISVCTVRSGAAAQTRLRITSSTSEYIYPLDTDGRYTIPGDLGTSIIVIKDGTAFFEDSPCPNKTCAACAPIRRNGEWIACLPNQIFIRIESKGTELDGTAF